VTEETTTFSRFLLNNNVYVMYQKKENTIKLRILAKIIFLFFCYTIFYFTLLSFFTYFIILYFIILIFIYLYFSLLLANLKVTITLSVINNII